VKKVISSAIKYGIPIAVSVGLAWFLYKNVDIDAIGVSLRQDVDYRWFIPVIVVSVLSHVFRALRWRLQLRAVGVTPPLHALVCSIFGTYFVNLLFPRLGEVWRSGYIAKRENASFATVLGSMVGDRLSDTVTVLTLTVVTFLLAQDKVLMFFNQGDNEGGMLASPTFWITVAFFALCAAGIVWVMRSRSQSKVVVKTQTALRNLWAGLASIGRMKGKWWFLLYTLLIWGCYFMQLYIAKFAFTFTRELGVLPILVLFVLSSIGMGVPSNGGLGPWQFAIIFGLALYGVGSIPLTTPYDPQASAFAWLVWGVQTALLIVLGIYTFAYIAIDGRRKKSTLDETSTPKE